MVFFTIIVRRLFQKFVREASSIQEKFRIQKKPKQVGLHHRLLKYLHFRYFRSLWATCMTSWLEVRLKTSYTGSRAVERSDFPVESRNSNGSHYRITSYIYEHNDDIASSEASSNPSSRVSRSIWWGRFLEQFRRGQNTQDRKTQLVLEDCVIIQ